MVGVCGDGTWRATAVSRTLGLVTPSPDRDGSWTCPTIKFGDSAYVGLLYGDSLVLNDTTAVTLAIQATTSGASARWLLPDLNAYLVQMPRASNEPLRVSLINYVAFARTIEPPGEVRIGMPGSYSVRLMVIEKIRTPCATARGAESILTIGPMFLSTAAAAPMSLGPRVIRASCG